MTAILGGGIAGLSAGFYALQNSKAGQIVLIEASNRVGGWIRSRRSPTDAVFEQGPRTVRVAGEAGTNTLNLIDRLQLTDKLMPVRMFHPAAKNRLIFAKGKLHILPTHVKSLFKVNEPFDRTFIKILFQELFKPKVKVEDESLYNFVNRRFGEDIADYLLSPIICGICAGDAKQISIKSFAKNIFEIEQKYGSIVKGLFFNKFLKEKGFKKIKKSSDENLFEAALTNSAKTAKTQNWGMWSLKGGLELLPKTLADTLNSHDIKIRLNSPCEQLTFRQGCVEVRVNNETEKYYRVISSLPAKNLAQLLKHQHPKLAMELEAIPTVTVAVVNLEFVEDLLPAPAFGFLVAPKENKPILGVTFDSCVFPNSNNSTVLTVMMGGAWFDTYFGKCSTEEHFLSVALEQVKDILNITANPATYHVSVLKDCIPQYVLGHSDRLKRIHNYILSQHLPLFLCGSSYDGIGINDVILSAKHVAANIV